MGKLSVGKILGLLLMLWVTFLFIVPFLWMISTSLKEPSDLAGMNWIPSRLAFENYVDAFRFGMWPQWTLNTVIITLTAVIGQVLSSSLVAYSFARLRWHGRDVLFSIVLATMMLPSVVTMIPQFVLFSKLPAFGFMGSKVWINTFLPLTVPAFTGNAFYIFLLRQFMRGIPMELSEAAKMDGASELRVWWSIVLPLTKPAVATVVIFTFQGAWQDFMGPLLYLQSEKLYTLQLGLRQFEAAAGGSPAWNWLMAASLLVMLPVLLVFVLFQRYFIEGISFSGMGGR
ncbi:MAG: carbohydrate ABC transporter permease [Chloroflexota bacterium]|nr:MAG: carbohydrate ABC transporter permease [Chloroflexota bacterium]